MDILGFFDLKSGIGVSHTSLSKLKEMAYELRQDSIFSDNGLSTKIRVSKMCRPIQRQLQDKEFYMYGPISLHGFCSTNHIGPYRAYRESLRDIEACLRATENKLYHIGIRGKVSRNTLANANQVRDWRIYADFAQVLIKRARRLYAGEDIGLQLDQTVYALDATTIDLCLSLFSWAKFRSSKRQPMSI